MYWNDLGITGGEDPITLGANNSGRGVGGGSVHWAAFTPRFHPSDFHVLSADGLGADWPISYEDLKPYYELIEKEMPVAGPAYFPWGDPHGYPYAPHPLGGVGDVLVKGCSKLDIPVVAGGPVAILEGSHGDRPHCIYRGFCIQGCKVGAKQSTLISHVPDAIRCGAEIRADSMVARVNLGKDGLVTGVTIQALVARTADYIISNRADLLSHHPSIIAIPHPPVRRNVSPPETANKGVPRIKPLIP